VSALLEVRGLHFAYAGGVKALDGVDLEVGTELVGLLGPNGAGKTTLLSVLSRRLTPQQGSGSLHGAELHDPDSRLAWLEHVEYLPQEEDPPRHLSGREVIELHLATARPLWPRRQRREAVAEALAEVGLSAAAERRAAGYSGGMKRRLGLARALAAKPTLLLIDEPTSGLDPEERVAFRELLSGLAEVSAVIVSTHIAADVEVSCSRVIVFLGGRVIWDGTPSELLASAKGVVRTCVVDEMAAAELARLYRVTAIVREGGRLHLRFLAHPDDSVTARPCEPTLEEAYIALVTAGHPDEEEEEEDVEA
jgi:ABC-type multidrug transport system ATPase subunit